MEHSTHNSGKGEHSDEEIAKYLKGILTVPTLEQDLNSLTPQEATKILGHCLAPATIVLPDTAAAIAKDGNFDREHLSLPANHKGPLRFEYAEHRYLGDTIRLPGFDKTEDPSARQNPLTLKNGLKLTYGQINGLSGDFFGTTDPIATGKDMAEQKARFSQAFKTLYQGDPTKINAILGVLKQEETVIDEAIKDKGSSGDSVREAYEKLGNSLEPALQEASTKGINPGQDYETLLKNNLDHFAPDSHTAYNAGHSLALETAQKGDLMQAYIMNAFADHFLEDSFASGHCRVPRREMIFKNIFSNICSNFMHNEDNFNGLLVQTPGPNPIEWTAYGDSMLFADDAKTNQSQIFKALQASVQEIYDAYSNPKQPLPQPAAFKAWTNAPSLDSLMSQKNYAPMFKVVNGQLWQRKGLDKHPKDRPAKWDFEPVVGKKFIMPDSVREYVYWGSLAYNLAPDGYIKELVRGKLQAWLKDYGIPDWMSGPILDAFGLKKPS